ncbi:GATA transcription factor 15-like isoform X1 [Magnolia sinica]|uniref:GATA transcription factor 15-like isoform X1 n=1 Tax=Magnolia sinica TaxID=86752 RepID=UPI0026594DED|nr:GATA transcription factor 15-like isoform X1 [Magnolia sinica]
MLSAAENISPDWDSAHHLHHHYYHHHHGHNHHHIHDRDHHPIQDNPHLTLGLDGQNSRNVHAKTHDQVAMTRKKRPTTGKSDVGFSDENQIISKVCADCRTSKTPLWRSGPAGPKSLCNACGIRYRKRRRRALDFLGEGGNMGMKEKQRKEKVLFLLQRKFAGEEEAEAAVLLMALSCGLFLHT